MKKAAAIAVTLILALACSEQQQAPTEVQLSKGGKGKPGNDHQVTLLEYWVQPLEDGTSLIHILAEGNATSVAPQVVHDYYFNGIADDDFNPLHYEYRHYGGVGRFSLEDAGDGTVQADIIWTGTRDVDREQFFVDQLTTDVDAADPFAFDLNFWWPGDGEPGPGGTISEGRWIQPQGVVVGGDVKGFEFTDGGATVYSYALYAGVDPAGSVWVEELSLSNVSCKTRRRATQVTADIHAVLGSDAGAPDAWLEFHLVADGNELEGVSVHTTTGTVDGTLTGTVTGDPDELSLWLDYVVPLGEVAGDYAYDPGLNAGDFYTQFAVATTPTGNAGPPAIAIAGPVTCR